MKLEVKNLYKSYKKNAVLKGVSFEAQGGEMIGILGGNGTGKTTLLSAMAGMCHGVKGEVLFDGANLLDHPKLSGDVIAYVPQVNPLMEELTGRDNLSLWYDGKILDMAIERGLLGRLGIGDFADKRVFEMSGGMKKRLAIGCALNSNAPIILLDEPTAALDLQAKLELYDFFEGIKKEGRILILVTHEKDEIAKCDRLFLFQNGKVSPYHYEGDERKLASDLSESFFG